MALKTYTLDMPIFQVTPPTGKKGKLHQPCLNHHSDYCLSYVSTISIFHRCFTWFLSVHFSSRSFWLKTPSTIWSLPTSSGFPGPTEFASMSLCRPRCTACNVMRKAVVAAHLLNQMCWLVVSIYPLLEVRSSTWRRKALCETMKQVSI